MEELNPQRIQPVSGLADTPQHPPSPRRTAKPRRQSLPKDEGVEMDTGEDEDHLLDSLA